MTKPLILIALFLFSSPAFAGYTELGFTANYRRSSIDDNNYQQSLSFTGSASYYFWEMSAIELSFTNGAAELRVQPPGEAEVITRSTYEMLGLDLVITFAGRQAAVQPYIKVGGAHLEKKIVRNPDGNDPVELKAPAGLVPSAGTGVKLRLSKHFLIKIGVDAWTSPLEEETTTVDWAGRAGISWVF